MPTTMTWLPTVIRVAIAPVLVGVLFLLVEPGRSARDLAAAVGLAVLAAIHVLYWWRPWPGRQRRAVVARDDVGTGRLSGSVMSCRPYRDPDGAGSVRSHRLA